jgi:hypothetical protein
LGTDRRLDLKNYTFSFAFFLYVASAVVDAVQGFTTFNVQLSYFLRAASVAAVIALYFQLVSGDKPLRALPFILASTALSLASLMFWGLNSIILLNFVLKACASLLTLKPELIEVEIVTEPEETQSENEEEQ